jgi:RNA polymerase sigma-70 factor (ECF subfamily)
VSAEQRHTAPAPDEGQDIDDVVVDVLSLRDTETFDGFYRRELPRLVTLAAALAGRASADDIAQEAMLAAYRRWEVVSRLDLPAAWVRRVCVNQATSMLRRRGAEARALLRLGARRDGTFETPPETDAFWAEVRRLPQRQAQTVALAYVYDLGVAEIAVTLGVSDGTVKTHLHRGRAALAERLARDVEEQDA